MTAWPLKGYAFMVRIVCERSDLHCGFLAWSASNVPARHVKLLMAGKGQLQCLQDEVCRIAGSSTWRQAHRLQAIKSGLDTTPTAACLDQHLTARGSSRCHFASGSGDLAHQCGLKHAKKIWLGKGPSCSPYAIYVAYCDKLNMQVVEGRAQSAMLQFA